MRSSHNLARVETTFDDDNVVPNAGLQAPAGPPPDGRTPPVRGCPDGTGPEEAATAEEVQSGVQA
jgi:hypothetical protein